MTIVRETEADVLFREDAAKLGYMEDDAHAPGDGRGLWAYYHDHNMVPPMELQDIAERELTNWDGVEEQGLIR